MPAAASSTTSRWSSSATRSSASSSPTCCSASSRSTTKGRSRSSRPRSSRRRRWRGSAIGSTSATFLILGRGEEKTGGRRKLALIADSYEALIAAIYLDGGFDPVRAFIERQFADLIAEARRSGAEAAFTEDYKSALQEWLQSRDRGLPVYRLAAEIGPAASAAVRGRGAGGRGAAGAGRRAEQEGSGAGRREGGPGHPQSISMMPQLFSPAGGAAERRPAPAPARSCGSRPST